MTTMHEFTRSPIAFLIPFIVLAALLLPDLFRPLQ